MCPRAKTRYTFEYSSYNRMAEVWEISSREGMVATLKFGGGGVTVAGVKDDVLGERLDALQASLQAEEFGKHSLEFVHRTGAVETIIKIGSSDDPDEVGRGLLLMLEAISPARERKPEPTGLPEGIEGLMTILAMGR